MHLILRWKDFQWRFDLKCERYLLDDIKEIFKCTLVISCDLLFKLCAIRDCSLVQSKRALWYLSMTSKKCPKMFFILFHVPTLRSRSQFFHLSFFPASQISLFSHLTLTHSQLGSLSCTHRIMDTHGMKIQWGKRFWRGKGSLYFTFSWIFVSFQIKISHRGTRVYTPVTPLCSSMDRMFTKLMGLQMAE